MISKEQMLVFYDIMVRADQNVHGPLTSSGEAYVEAIRNLIEKYGPGEAVGMKSPSPQEESDTDGGALRRGNPLAGSMEATSHSPGPSPEDMDAETAIGLVAHLVGFYAESQQGWMLQKSDLKELVPTLRRLISPSSNGRTPDFQSGGEGSIPSGDASPEDREAVERLDGDVNELYGNLGRNHPTLATSEYSESRKALAHIRRRLGMEEGKS